MGENISLFVTGTIVNRKNISSKYFHPSAVSEKSTCCFVIYLLQLTKLFHGFPLHSQTFPISKNPRCESPIAMKLFSRAPPQCPLILYLQSCSYAHLFKEGKNVGCSRRAGALPLRTTNRKCDHITEKVIT